MSAAAKQFHLGDLLTITTGKMCSPDGMGGIYHLLEHLTGEPIWTHQIPRVSQEAKPHVLAAFPALADVDSSDLTPETFKGWITAQMARYGEWFDVEPMPPGAHHSIDPVSELAEMVHPRKIAVVVDDGDDGDDDTDEGEAP